MFSTTPDAGDDRHMKIVTMDQRTSARRAVGRLVRHRAPAGRPRTLATRCRRSTATRADLASVAGCSTPTAIRATSSDIAALLTFSHQTHMTNLLTRASWEARAADPALHPRFRGTASEDARGRAMMSGIAEEVVDYMLFVDEAPLPQPVARRDRDSPSGCRRADRATARDARCYELDLERRLMKYPCSYLIYSPAFDALPPLAKAPIYRRLWQVLSGDAREPRYRALSLRGSTGRSSRS